AYTDIVVATLPGYAKGVAGSLAMVTRTIGVVSAATALTAVMDHLERHHLGLGIPLPAAFEAAFGTVFLYAGSILAALFALGGLRLLPGSGRWAPSDQGRRATQVERVARSCSRRCRRTRRRPSGSGPGGLGADGETRVGLEPARARACARAGNFAKPALYTV